jgi:hypothetical protein
MQQTTAKWKENQRQPLTSEGFVEVLYTINDPNATARAEGIHQHRLSTMPPGQNPPLVDETEHTVIPYATLEQNLWLLNGSRVTVPSDGNYGYSGFISKHLCNASGSFTDNPLVRIRFEKPVPILPGITITWSTVFDDFPTEFKVTPYSNEIAYTSKVVADNSDIVSVVAFEMTNFNRIDIEIIKWVTPHRRARIERIFPGLFKSYMKSDLLKFTGTQSVDLLSASLPKYEVSFEIDNRDGSFNPLNPDGLSKYMMERQEISTRYGFKTGNALEDIEWIPGGVYFLSDWSAPQNGISASFKARDLLGFLNATYYKGRFAHASEPNGISLYTLALEVLREANLPQRKTDTDADYRSPWELDEVMLKRFTTTAPLPICTFGECLQMIANAACCTIFFDRDGILHITKLGDTNEELMINDRNSYTKSEVSLTKPVKQIDVSMYSFTRETDRKSIYEGTLPITAEEKEFIIEYSNIADSVLLDLSPNVVVNTNETEYYAKSCKLVLSSSNNQTIDCMVTITGYERKSTEAIITTSNSPAGETQPLKNPLITNAEHAAQVGQWLKLNLNRRTHMSIEWRADPRLDAGDIVKIGEPGQNVRVVSSGFSFSGAFKGKVEGVEI